MKKTILVTGATDGIGLETVRMLAQMGHNVLVHGRSPTKLDHITGQLSKLADGGRLESYLADLSKMVEVEQLADAVRENHSQLDVLINNAGVFNTPEPVAESGIDVRFVVNAIAPYLLTKKLLPLMAEAGRIINLSSAAQAPVDVDALQGKRKPLADAEAYAQSKLAITMWSRSLAASLDENGPTIIAVNPKSLLGSKMVKQAYGTDGHDVRIGGDILCRAALSDEFANRNGEYFDNDIGRFSTTHSDALDLLKCMEIERVIEEVLGKISRYSN